MGLPVTGRNHTDVADIDQCSRGGQPISPPLQGLKRFLTRSDIELVLACNPDTPDVNRDPRDIASLGIDLPSAQFERLIQYRRAVFPIVPTRSVRTAQERTNLGIDISILRGLFRKLRERIERASVMCCPVNRGTSFEELDFRRDSRVSR